MLNKNNNNSFLFIVIASALLLATTTTFVTANWRGPYDTHDEHSLWLRTQMEKTPLKDFRLNDESAGYNIMDFGAIASKTDEMTSRQNGMAFYRATVMANQSSTKPRVVIVPAGFTFWFIPYDGFRNLYNLTFQFNGNISAYSGNQTGWPSCFGGTVTSCPVIGVNGGSDINFVGNGGVINGYGFAWWVNQYPPNKGGPRPMLIQIWNLQHVVLDHVLLFDSPYYHFMCHQTNGLLIQYSKVEVDIFKQYELHKQHGTFLHPEIDLPLTFPLNTDGFDLEGQTMVLRYNHVENFDDAYCPKPESISHCTQNILVENSSVHFGVGNTIGSVPPSTSVNCVQNVTFNNIYGLTVLKGIYDKPNPASRPGTSGIIRDITYSNFYSKYPLWWGIWVSTQQQAQPNGGADTGCNFFYPLPGTKCPTDPTVPIRNLIFKNVTMFESLLSPGVLRCNNTVIPGLPFSGPCTGWKWTNVETTSILKWPMGDNYLCHAIVDPVFVNVSSPCQDNIDFENSPFMMKKKRAHQHRVLEAITEHGRVPDADSLATKEVLDELAALMKAKGISLYQRMLDVKSGKLR